MLAWPDRVQRGIGSAGFLRLLDTTPVLLLYKVLGFESEKRTFLYYHNLTSSMNNYYNTISESYDELHGAEQLRKFSLVKQFIRGKVLDVGCGTGIVWKENRTRDSELETQDVTGIDPSKELLKKAKHIKTVLGSGESLPFPDKSFDTVTCFTAIHNFDDYKKGLEEMERVSKGVVIVTVLKKSLKRKKIGEEIKKMFKNIKLIDDVTDDVYIGRM